MNESGLHVFWRRFKKDRLAVLGGGIVVFIALVSIFASYLTPFDPIYQYADGISDTGRPLPPNGKYLLGTDRYGRDVFSRLILGTRISMTAGIVANGIAMVLGVVVGTLAGYMSSWVEAVFMRLTDVMLSIPMLLLAMALVAIWKPSLWVVIIVIAICYWTALARVIHGEVLRIKQYTFVEATRALGGSPLYILVLHVIPQLVGIIVVYMSLGVATTVMLEASLSYLGLGVPQPTPSWGGMVADGQSYFMYAPWLVVYPGLAVMITVFAFNLLGDGLRDALESRIQRD